MESEPGINTTENLVGSNKTSVESCTGASAFSDSSGYAENVNTCGDGLTVISETSPVENNVINGICNNGGASENGSGVGSSAPNDCRSMSLLETIKEDSSQDEGSSSTTDAELLGEDIGSATQLLPVIVVNPVEVENTFEGEDEMEPLLAVDDTESLSSDMISLDTVSYDIINLDVGEDDDQSIGTMSTASYDIKLDSPFRRSGSRASDSSMTTQLLDNSKKDSSESEVLSPIHQTVLNSTSTIPNELDICVPSTSWRLSAESRHEEFVIETLNTSVQACSENQGLISVHPCFISDSSYQKDECSIESEEVDKNLIVSACGEEGDVIKKDDNTSSPLETTMTVVPAAGSPDLNPPAADKIANDIFDEKLLLFPVHNELMSTETDKTNLTEGDSDRANRTETKQCAPDVGEIFCGLTETISGSEPSSPRIQAKAIFVKEGNECAEMDIIPDLTSPIEDKNEVEDITTEGKGHFVELAGNVAMEDRPRPGDECVDNDYFAPVTEAVDVEHIEKLDPITAITGSESKQQNISEINSIAIGKGAGDSAKIIDMCEWCGTDEPVSGNRNKKSELPFKMPAVVADSNSEVLVILPADEVNLLAESGDEETPYTDETNEKPFKGVQEPFMISVDSATTDGKESTVQGVAGLREELIGSKQYKENTAVGASVGISASQVEDSRLSSTRTEPHNSAQTEANVSSSNCQSKTVVDIGTARELASNLVNEILDVAAKEIQHVGRKSVNMLVNENATQKVANAIIEEVLDLAVKRVSDARGSTHDRTISFDEGVEVHDVCDYVVEDPDQGSEYVGVSEFCDKSDASESTLAECVLEDCSVRRVSDEDLTLSRSSSIDIAAREVTELENYEGGVGKSVSLDVSHGSDSARGSSLLSTNVSSLHLEANIFVDGVIEQAVHHIEEKKHSPEKIRPSALNSDFSEVVEEELSTPCGELLTEHFMDFESGRNVSVFRSMPDEDELLLSSEHLFAYDRVVSTIGNCEVDSDTGKSVSVFRSDDEIFYEIQRGSTCTSVFESVEEEDEDMVDTTVPLEDRKSEESINISDEKTSNNFNRDVPCNPKDKDCDAFEDAVDAFLEKERTALNEQKFIASALGDIEIVEKSDLTDELGTGLRRRNVLEDESWEKVTGIVERKKPAYEVISLSTGKHSDAELSDSEEKKRMAARWANGGESEVPNTPDMWEKQLAIQEALKSGTDVTSKLCKLALTEGGLISDALRREAWPRMLGLDPTLEVPAPPLEELKSHPEYGQVVLDVNRSLKRFPPDIPHDQRETLQDKLTRLIMYVITKYPHLRYYQGYHDVAVTFLLVVGEAVAFQIMERLSTEHLSDCMQPTMERTSYLLHYIYPLLHRLHPTLADYLERSEVGTMFCLPWFLTWFGHSLNRYQDVVRLYDHFLASPPLAPLYLAAVLVAHRADEVLAVDCDMAAIHALLSHIPDTLPLEILLRDATDLYERYPPASIEQEVEERFKNEQEMRIHEMEARDRIRRQRALQRRHGSGSGSGTWQVMELHNRIAPAMMAFNHWMPPWVVQQQRLSMRLLFASATFFAGFYYMYARGGDAFPYP